MAMMNGSMDAPTPTIHAPGVAAPMNMCHSSLAYLIGTSPSDIPLYTSPSNLTEPTTANVTPARRPSAQKSVRYHFELCLFSGSRSFTWKREPWRRRTWNIPQNTTSMNIPSGVSAQTIPMTNIAQ